MNSRPPAADRVGRRSGWLIPAVAALVVAADQLSKNWALGHLHYGEPRHVVGPTYLDLTFNSGAAFGLGTGVTPIIEALAVVLVAWLLFATHQVGRNVRPLTAVGVGLLLGGALGNLTDRVLRHHHGAVVDFIQAVSWWPVFNVADASITVGVIVLAVSFLASSRG
jgi:signal peptidase II